MRKSAKGEMIYEDYEVEKIAKYYEGLKLFSKHKKALEDMGFDYFTEKYGKAIILEELPRQVLDDLIFIKTEHKNNQHKGE